MFIGIDTSLTDIIVLSAFTSTQWEETRFPVAKPGELLACVDTFLKYREQTVQDIEGIAVVVGKGRFTSTRVAVTVANTLAFSLRVPVVATESLDNSTVKQLKTKPVGVYALAAYSAPPSIGKK